MLEDLPDLSQATDLEVLVLSGCSMLTRVHPSIFSLPKLEKLDLRYCESLTILTSDCHLCNLSYLNLDGCSNLTEFSLISENMKELRLGRTKIKDFPSSFRHQRKLKLLHKTGSDIERLPSSIDNFMQLLEDCESLKTVLFPSTAVEQLNENRTRVQFWNCLNLDEHSLVAIGLNAQINTMKFANQHLSTPNHDHVENYNDYDDNYIVLIKLFMRIQEAMFQSGLSIRQEMII